MLASIRPYRFFCQGKKRLGQEVIRKHSIEGINARMVMGNLERVKGNIMFQDPKMLGKLDRNKGIITLQLEIGYYTLMHTLYIPFFCQRQPSFLKLPFSA